MDRLIGLILLRWKMDLRGLRRTPERLAGLMRQIIQSAPGFPNTP